MGGSGGEGIPKLGVGVNSSFRSTELSEAGLKELILEEVACVIAVFLVQVCVNSSPSRSSRVCADIQSPSEGAISSAEVKPLFCNSERSSFCVKGPRISLVRVRTSQIFKSVCIVYRFLTSLILIGTFAKIEMVQWGKRWVFLKLSGFWGLSLTD